MHMVRAQSWLNSSMSCSAKRLVYNGNLTQKREKSSLFHNGEIQSCLKRRSHFIQMMVHTAPAPRFPCLQLSLLVHAVPGRSLLLPTLGRGLMDFLGFQLFSMCISKSRSCIMFMANVSGAWLISWHKYHLGGTNEAASNLASYLISHRLPVKSWTNHSPVPQDEAAGLS